MGDTGRSARASVNPTDCKQRAGVFSQIWPLSLLCILGIDLAGRVVRAGEDAPFSEGDEVFGRQQHHHLRYHGVVPERGDCHLAPSAGGFVQDGARGYPLSWCTLGTNVGVLWRIHVQPVLPC